MTNPNGKEFSKRLRDLYPLPKTDADLNAAETRRGLNRILRPDSLQSGDGLVTSANENEFDEKLHLDDADEMDLLSATVIFVGERPGSHHKEKVRQHELTQKKQMLKALRDYSGLKMVEVKSLAYPKGILNVLRVTAFVQSLHTYRSMMDDFDLVVPLELVDQAGCITVTEVNITQSSKKHIKLDDEASRVLKLLGDCEEIDHKKRPKTTKFYQ